MSKLFNPDVNRPYIGAINTLPSGIYAPSREASRVVPLQFDWASYGINSGAFARTKKVLIQRFDEAPAVPTLDYEFANTDNSFTFPNYTDALTPDHITLTAVAVDPQFISPVISLLGTTNFTIEIDLQVLTASATWQGACFYSTSGHGFSGSFFKSFAQPATGVRTTISLDMSALTAGGTDYVNNTITQLRFDFFQDIGSVIRIYSIKVISSVRKLFTVPDDYQSLGATLELLGAGEDGAGLNGGADNREGGGGGAYSLYNAPTLIPGAQLYAQVASRLPWGFANGDHNSWVNFTGANAAPTVLAEGALANGGHSGNGGITSASIGHVKFAGGNSNTSGRIAGNGGGASAGPNGAGANGGLGATTTSGNGGGGGGGGANGGSSGGNGTNSGPSGNGGNNRFGVGGGIAESGNGTLGGGGAGGTPGGFGSEDTIWTDTETGNAFGPSSGGGGGNCHIGGNGGNGADSHDGRGGGGGAGGRSNSGGVNGSPGAGSNGLIVLSYFSSDMLSEDIEVDVDLKQTVLSGALDHIVSVHIDNSNSNITVYVRFPDSQQTVIASPGAVVYQPVITNGLQAQILASGFTGFVNQPKTVINFTNRYVAPQSDLQQNTTRPQFLGSTFKGNPNINQQKFRYLAVGDLMFTNWITCDSSAAAGDNLVIFQPPIVLSGYYVYITDLSIFIRVVRNITNSTIPATFTLQGFTANLIDDTAIVNYAIPVFINLQQWNDYYQVLDLKNSQIKYPSTSLLSFTTSSLAQKSGAVLPLPASNVLAYIAMNYSIVDERNAE